MPFPRRPRSIEEAYERFQRAIDAVDISEAQRAAIYNAALDWNESVQPDDEAAALATRPESGELERYRAALEIIAATPVIAHDHAIGVKSRNIARAALREAR